MFSAADFDNALDEFENPDLLEYQYFAEAMSIKIYRKFIPVSGLYEYKVFGELDCKSDVCHKVYMDLEYRKIWDSYVAELFDVQDGELNMIYWNVKYLFPLSNRDYVYQRESQHFSRNGKKTWVILAKSHSTHKIPPKKKVIRVDDFHQFMVIQEDGKKTKAFMHYYDNPKGMIPTWLINWAAKTGIPSFLKSMKDACDSFKDTMK